MYERKEMTTGDHKKPKSGNAFVALCAIKNEVTCRGGERKTLIGRRLVREVAEGKILLRIELERTM